MRATLKLRDQQPGEVGVDMPKLPPDGVVAMLTRLALHALEQSLTDRDNVILVSVEVDVRANVYVAQPGMAWQKAPLATEAPNA
jgi:hypothetical protein